MTDRELLELAAKAAGIVINTSMQAERDALNLQKSIGLWTTTDTNWNPLTDDGDALRLAVKLDFLLDCKCHCALEDSKTGAGKDDWKCGDELSDPYAATRRAIVRAAAEIGKTK